MSYYFEPKIFFIFSSVLRQWLLGPFNAMSFTPLEGIFYVYCRTLQQPLFPHNEYAVSLFTLEGGYDTNDVTTGHCESNT